MRLIHILTLPTRAYSAPVSLLTAFMSLGLALAGCRAPGEPRIRIGSYPTATWGMHFSDLNDMGPHSYDARAREGNGIVYTRQAGHIDITHVRSTADWTKYVAEMAFPRLREGRPYFTFR